MGRRLISPATAQQNARLVQVEEERLTGPELSLGPAADPHPGRANGLDTAHDQHLHCGVFQVVAHGADLVTDPAPTSLGAAVAGAGFAPARRLVDHASQPNPPKGELMMGEPQRLSDTEQLQILALLEAVNTEPSAMRAARALARLMRRLHVLGERIAGELSGQDRDLKSVRR